LKLTNQKRLAAEIMKAGRTRVWIDPERIEDVEVITRDEVRKLIHEGVIKARPEGGVSRARARARRMKLKRGLGSGYGSRKGKKTARNPRKKMWEKEIRAIRKHLRELVDRRIIQRSAYRRLYLLAKGNILKDIGQVDQYIEAHRLTRRR